MSFAESFYFCAENGHYKNFGAIGQRTMNLTQSLFIINVDF